MAESTSIDATPQNGHTHVHEPRARKPTRIDFLRPRLSDETIGTNGQINGHASGTSRWVYVPQKSLPFFSGDARVHVLIRIVDELPPSPKMLPLRSRLLRRRVARFEPNRDGESFLPSSTLIAYPTSTRQATTETSAASSCCSGLVLP